MADITIPLRVKLSAELIGREEWNTLIDHVDEIATVKADKAASSLTTIAVAAACASASTKKFSRRALFGFMRRSR